MLEIYQVCACGSGLKTKFCCYTKRTSYHEMSPQELLEKSTDFRVYETWINQDWQTTGLAYILVVRQLFSLRYISSFYLVDTFAFGLISTFSQVDVNSQDIQTLKEEIPSELVKTSYEDVRCLVLGAMNYARQSGFELSSAVLADWEKSKHLIESEVAYESKFSFGKNGQPYFIEGANNEVLIGIKDLRSFINESKSQTQSSAAKPKFHTSQKNENEEESFEFESDEDLELEDDVFDEEEYEDDEDLEEYLDEEDDSEEENYEDGDEESFDTLCEFITEDLEEGYYEDALEGSEKLVENYPQEAMSYFYMGTTLAMMGDSSNGITYFQRAIEIEPAGEFYHNLGRAYSELGQFSEALESWEKTVELEGPEELISKQALKEISLLKGRLNQNRMSL